MEENIIELIAAAEAKAAEIKSEAQAKAAERIAAAEAKATEISVRSESDCAELRRKSLKEAETGSAAAYDKSLADSRAEAVKYADGLLAYSDNQVAEIIGRLVK